jgi:hypothetical protein
MSPMFSMSLVFLNFLPLWLIVLAREGKSILDHSACQGAEWCVIAGIVAGTLFAWVYVVRELKKTLRNGPKPGEKYAVCNAWERKTLTAEILLAYVLPLWAFNFTEWRGVAEFLVFFFVIVALAARHMDMSGSLFLELLKYRYYDCDVKRVVDGRVPESSVAEKRMVIVKGTLESANGTVWYLRLMNDQLMLALEQYSTTKKEEEG